MITRILDWIFHSKTKETLHMPCGNEPLAQYAKKLKEDSEKLSKSTDDLLIELLANQEKKLLNE